MRRIFYVFLFFLFISFAYGADLYRWVDKEGVVHFTDDESTIPSEYREGVKTEKMKPSSPPSVSPRKSSGSNVGASGLGEGYWRSKVQPWKKELSEARSKLEEINRKMRERDVEQSGRHLTHTQWNMHAAERKQFIEERSKYEAQIREANEMLEKIAREAREARADPRWLQ